MCHADQPTWIAFINTTNIRVIIIHIDESFLTVKPAERKTASRPSFLIHS
jgi:hypothetical protein